MLRLSSTSFLLLTALASQWTADAQGRRTQPLDLRTNTDYPLQGQPVTLTSYWEGIRPPWTPRYQVRYQISRGNPPAWVELPGAVCSTEPCTVNVNSPGAAEFQGRPNGVVIQVRAVVRDTTTGRDSPANSIKTVTWLPGQNPEPAASNGSGYFISISVNGQAGCTVRPRRNDTSYENAACRARGPLDVHEGRIPVVRISPDGRGRFVSAPFSIVATWGPLPPGEWSVAITSGAHSTRCNSSPCTLNVPQMPFEGEMIGRANAVAGITWREGTRDNPSVHGWPSGLTAETGIDFMRR